MNSFNLLRLAIPTVKVAFKSSSSKDTLQPLMRKSKLLQFSPQPGFIEIDPTKEPTLNILDLPADVPQKSSSFNSQTEQDTDDLQYERQQMNQSSLHLQRNFIDNRMKSLQYEANAPCEDSMVYEQLKTLDAYTVSIFDGHGGPQLAEYSKQKINGFIDCYLKDHIKTKTTNIGQLIKQSLAWSYKKLEDSFFEIYEQHLKLGNKKIKSVGTCGITAVIHNDRVYIGNTGDSMGMFILSQGKSLMKTQKTNDRLSVNNRAERERIKQKWKEVDEDIISEETNNCFYLKGRLQPTRTIGDYYLKKTQYFNGQGQFKGPYLTCDPDIHQFKLTQAHQYMVLASDGLWDVLSKSEVMNSLINGKEIDLSKTCYGQMGEEESPYVKNTLECVLKKCGQVTGKSLKEVRNIEPGRRRNYHDDITIAVINLGNQH